MPSAKPTKVVKDLPSGVRFIRKYRITRKRILNSKTLGSHVD